MRSLRNTYKLSSVVKGNLPAERLYQKCGYQLVGTVSLGYEEYGIPWYDLYEKRNRKKQLIVTEIDEPKPVGK